MTLVFRSAAASHVGLVSSQNEDSGYAGTRVLAVADGMGGHVFGEVASAITIATVSELDSVDLTDPGMALRNVAAAANEQIADRIRRDPRLEGMGTTLTALVLYGEGQLGLVHVGDSRAYRLRQGRLEQLSHDHTLVQALVDEGRLTKEQAKKHPYRNMITNAMQGTDRVEADTGADEVRVGDRLLVCSDGLPDAPVFDADIERVLREAPDPADAAATLVDLALKAGGPDNVTCVVGDVVPGPLPVTPEPIVVGAAANPEVDIHGDATSTQIEPFSDDGTDLALGYGDLDDDERLRYAPRPPRRFRWLMRAVLAVVVLGVLAGGAKLAYDWSQQQYYVGTVMEENPLTGRQEERVAIYRGVSQQIPGLRLSTVVEVAPMTVDSLPEYHRERLSETIPAGDLAHARRIVGQLQTQRTQE